MHVWRPRTYYDTLATETSVVRRSYLFFQNPGGRHIDQTNFQLCGTLPHIFLITGIVLFTSKQVIESQSTLNLYVGEYTAVRIPLANLRRDTQHYGKPRYEYVPAQDHVPPLAPLELPPVQGLESARGWAERAQRTNEFVITPRQNIRLELLLGAIDAPIEARVELHGHALVELV